eukprot:gene11460-11606_t
MLPLLLTGVAAAADVDIDDAVLDAAYSAEYSQSAGSTDLLVSVLAVVVFVLLAVVTAGVAYLTLKTWLDDRQETQDRDGAGKAPAAGFKAVDNEEEEPERKRIRVKREKQRGFGSN